MSCSHPGVNVTDTGVSSQNLMPKGHDGSTQATWMGVMDIGIPGRPHPVATGMRRSSLVEKVGEGLPEKRILELRFEEW